MANSGLGDAFADGLIDIAQRLRFLSHPSDDAGRTDQRRAEQIAQRSRGSILGDQLLDVQIDRRRLDALAILGRRDHAFGKRRLGHASAMQATVDRGPMFRDQQRALGDIEHLALLDPDRPLRIQRQTATPTQAGLMQNNRVGVAHLPQRAAPVALLTAARLARATAQADGEPGLLLQPIAGRRLGAIRTIEAQSTPKLRILGFKHRKTSLKRRYQFHDFGRKHHTAIDSDSFDAVFSQSVTGIHFHRTCDLSDSPRLGSYVPTGRCARGLLGSPNRQAIECGGKIMHFVSCPGKAKEMLREIAQTKANVSRAKRFGFARRGLSY